MSMKGFKYTITSAENQNTTWPAVLFPKILTALTDAGFNIVSQNSGTGRIQFLPSGRTEADMPSDDFPQWELGMDATWGLFAEDFWGDTFADVAGFNGWTGIMTNSPKSYNNGTSTIYYPIETLFCCDASEGWWWFIWYQKSWQSGAERIFPMIAVGSRIERHKGDFRTGYGPFYATYSSDNEMSFAYGFQLSNSLKYADSYGSAWTPYGYADWGTTADDVPSMRGVVYPVYPMVYSGYDLPSPFYGRLLDISFAFNVNNEDILDFTTYPGHLLLNCPVSLASNYRWTPKLVKSLPSADFVQY